MEPTYRVSRHPVLVSLVAPLLAIPVLAAIYVREVLRPEPAIRLGAAFAAVAIASAVTLSAANPDPGRAGEAAQATPDPGAFQPVEVPSTVADPDAHGPSRVSDTFADAGERETSAPGPPPPDRTGEAALAAAALPPPHVVRFRPRDGTADVDPPLEVSVRFSQPMEPTASTAAFTVTVDGTAWSGTPRWAEAKTVLVVRLPKRLPYDASVVLAVSTEARSFDGTPLGAAAQASFSIAVAPPPPPTPTPRPAATPAPAGTPAPATPRPSSSGWGWPLIGPITQRFGESLTQYGYHQGLDIDGDTGDPVRAARAGRVILAGYGDSCGGIQVQLDHGGGLQTWYRHLSAVAVKVGQRVDLGQVVGKVGNTGCSLGSHLHFAVRVNGTFVDPLRYLPKR